MQNNKDAPIVAPTVPQTETSKIVQPMKGDAAQVETAETK